MCFLTRSPSPSSITIHLILLSSLQLMVQSNIRRKSLWTSKELTSNAQMLHVMTSMLDLVNQVRPFTKKELG